MVYTPTTSGLGTPLGLPLCLTLADGSFVYFEKNWLQNYPSDLSDFMPRYYRWYVDDIFVLFTSIEHLQAFRNFIKSRHSI